MLGHSAKKVLTDPGSILFVSSSMFMAANNNPMVYLQVPVGLYAMRRTAQGEAGCSLKKLGDMSLLGCGVEVLKLTAGDTAPPEIAELIRQNFGEGSIYAATALAAWGVGNRFNGHQLAGDLPQPKTSADNPQTYYGIGNTTAPLSAPEVNEITVAMGIAGTAVALADSGKIKETIEQSPVARHITSSRLFSSSFYITAGANITSDPLTTATYAIMGWGYTNFDKDKNSELLKWAGFLKKQEDTPSQEL